MRQRIEKIFWSLLRTGLFGADGNLSCYGTLTDEDWKKIYALSVEQGLTGIVFSAVEHLPKTQLPPIRLLMNWYGQVDYIKRHNVMDREKAGELLGVFRGRGLVPVVLKGEACARYYPQPDRRILGDLDVFLLKDADCSHNGAHEWAYEEGNRLAAMMGAEVEIHDYKHSHIDWKGLMVENHRLLTTARGGKKKKELEAYLQKLVAEFGLHDDKFKPSEAIKAEALFEALFLTLHAFHHFMVGELTVRQLCDWAVFVKSRGNEVNWATYLYWMERMGMMPFVRAVRYITQYYMAVNVDFDLAPSDDKRLARKILEDTLYGKHEQMSAEHIVRYRIWQTYQIFRSSWKYRMFCNENVLIAYSKMLWAHWCDKV